MTIKDYFNGLNALNHAKAKEEKIITEDIKELEKNPVVQAYKERQKELSSLNYRYSKNALLRDIADNHECDHPMYVYEIDLLTLNDAVSCARCIVCGEYFYDIEDVDMVDLFESKRILAKEVSYGNDDSLYDLTYTDYDVSLNDLRRIYYKLSVLSEDNTKFNAEDYLFDHLTGNNPNIRRRKK